MEMFTILISVLYFQVLRNSIYHLKNKLQIISIKWFNKWKQNLKLWFKNKYFKRLIKYAVKL